MFVRLPDPRSLLQGERCAAEEGEADLDAAFEREWAAMLAGGAPCSKDDMHARCAGVRITHVHASLRSCAHVC